MNYLTTKEAAEQYRISMVTVYRLIKKREIQAIKMGQKWLIEPPKVVNDEKNRIDLIQKALNSFGDEMINTCVLINREDEVEIKAVQFGDLIKKYAETISKLATWTEEKK
jgi:excisionase family DNA binding protein